MEYFQAADKLANLVGSHDQFANAKRLTEQIYAKCREAGSALMRHRAECDWRA